MWLKNELLKEIQYVTEPDQEFPEELTAREQEEQERAARSIQVRHSQYLFEMNMFLLLLS